MPNNNPKLTRIGVFYDGGYLSHISNYYMYHHPRRARLSIGGLHEFIRAEVARHEKADDSYCRIVDAHYFRGRLSTAEAQRSDRLVGERKFEEVLMREGVITHYLPLNNRGAQREKGIDVWLALEAYELAAYKQFDVVVLVASDGDYVPLVRKLNTIGSRVMLLGWDFQFEYNGIQQETRTSQALVNEVNYPIMVSSEIDSKTRRNDPLIEKMFLQYETGKPAYQGDGYSSAPSPYREQAPRGPYRPQPAKEDNGQLVSDEEYVSEVQALKNGYGFLGEAGPSQRPIYFHYSALDGITFNELQPGEYMRFQLASNDQGYLAVNIRRADESEYEGEMEESQDEDQGY